MKTKYIFLNLYLILFANIFQSELLNAQSWKWGSEGKGSVYTFANQDGGGVAADIYGNAYIAGEYLPIILFGSDTLISNKGANLFLIKYDLNGRTLWATQGRLYNDSSTIIAITDHIDDSGNIYVLGYFYWIVYFGTYQLNGGLNPNHEQFLAKYNSNGTCLWAIKVTPAFQSGIGYSIASDNKENVFITGSSFDSNFQQKYFIVKYNSMGTQLWARNTEWATLTSGAYSHSITTDKSGNSYITGYFLKGSCAFGTDTLSTKLVTNAFLAKFDSAGNFQWVKQPIGRAAGYDTSTAFSKGTSVITDNVGNVYLSGWFDDTLDFGSFTLTAPSGGDTSRLFFVKYNAQGNVIWAQASSPGATIIIPYSLAKDTLNNIYMGGVGIGDTKIENLILHSANWASYYSFIVKFDTAGNILCGSLLNNGAGSFMPPMAIASDLSGKYIYMTATTNFGDTVICGTDTLVANVGSGNTPYLASWQPCNNFNEDVRLISSQNYSVSISPNPTSSSFTISGITKGQTIELYNYMGQKVETQNIATLQSTFNISNQPNGIYLIRILNKDEREVAVKKIVKTN